LIERFREYAEGTGELGPGLAELLRSEIQIGPLTDIIAHALSLPAALKQALLADREPERRALGLLGFVQHLAERDSAITRPAFPPPFSAN
jgi:hypothetical protein